ncbi:unnamed protein product [Pedinophyceae sp. YPF-701]|nr:unnamed protein product [Pedinophyceae sp. YPF-701]
MARPDLVPTLRELCIRVVSDTFEKRPTFVGLQAEDIKSITERLPLDLPLELAGDVIDDERYWWRRSTRRWRNSEVGAHGNSWKQLYFERNLQDALEQFDPEMSDLDQLRRLLSYSARFVRFLEITQLPSHLDLAHIFDCLDVSLCGLSLTYGMRDVGMDFERGLFGMRLPDCRSLARCLESCEALTCLSLSNNTLDDDGVRMLMSGMVDNLSVTHLDLSCNKIADRGVRALAKVLDSRCTITSLDLSDNVIHQEGGRALARALKQAPALTRLNLALNQIGDEGIRAISHVLQDAWGLTHLSLSANSGSNECVGELAALMQTNTVLRILDVSCNELGPASGPIILDALAQNEGLTKLDVRLCGLETEDMLRVEQALRQRQDAEITERVMGR